MNSCFYEEGVLAPSSALVNVLIHGNHALYTGGGVHTNGTALRLKNITIVGNSARDAGGISMGKSGTSTINNSIIYGNTREQGSSNPNVHADQYKAVFNNTLVGGATAWDTGWGIDGGNNKSSTTDPFTDSDAMDYTLKVGSEAINAGDNDLYDFDEYGGHWRAGFCTPLGE